MNHAFTRRQLLLAASTLALAAPAFAFGFGFGHETVKGSGHVSKQARQVAHFTGLALSVPGDVELHTGTAEGVSIEADDNLLPLIETVVENGTLKIRPVHDNMQLRPHTLHITVNAREIDQLKLGGSGSINADDLRARKLEMSLGGSGSIKARSLQADEVEVHVAGSGDLSAAGGTAGRLEVKLAGSGDVNLGKVKAGDVKVQGAGSGNTTVWAVNTLSAKLAGSGDVDYYGDPRVTRTVVGSSDVRRAGPAPR